jgi:transcriptional regulator with XRE-family HTH domain
MSIKLNKILEKELKRRKLSITQLANDCGISVSVLHGWVKGTLPSAKNLHQIKTLSEHLKIPVDQMLFTGSDEDQRSHLILFSSTFRDGDTQYKLTIEKIKEEQ